MTNYFVETTAFNDDGQIVTDAVGRYYDGRQIKHFHTDAKLAAVDFGERVGMLSREGLIESDITVDGSVVTFQADYNGLHIQVTLY